MIKYSRHKMFSTSMFDVAVSIFVILWFCPGCTNCQFSGGGSGIAALGGGHILEKFKQKIPCMDFLAECESEAADGGCEGPKAALLLQNCAKSCDSCFPTVAEDCINKGDDLLCDIGRYLGACQTSHIYHLRKCAHSCRDFIELCDEATVRSFDVEGCTEGRTLEKPQNFDCGPTNTNADRGPRKIQIINREGRRRRKFKHDKTRHRIPNKSPDLTKQSRQEDVSDWPLQVVGEPRVVIIDEREALRNVHTDANDTTYLNNLNLFLSGSVLLSGFTGLASVGSFVSSSGTNNVGGSSDSGSVGDSGSSSGSSSGSAPGGGASGSTGQGIGSSSSSSGAGGTGSLPSVSAQTTIASVAAGVASIAAASFAAAAAGIASEDIQTTVFDNPTLDQKPEKISRVLVPNCELVGFRKLRNRLQKVSSKNDGRPIPMVALSLIRAINYCRFGGPIVPEMAENLATFDGLETRNTPPPCWPGLSGSDMSACKSDVDGKAQLLDLDLESMNAVIKNMIEGIEDDDIEEVLTRKAFFCGGALISPRHILTAAHCIQPSRELNVVRLGEVDFRTTNESDEHDFVVKNKLLHKSYDFKSKVHDIAILELDREVPESFNIPIYCLFPDIEDYTNRICTASGWGYRPQKDVSQILINVNVTVRNTFDCNQNYSKEHGAGFDIHFPNGLTSDTLCASSDGVDDVCRGDSGGPLILNDVGNSPLIGIVSNGHGCGAESTPTIYTRIDGYKDFINKSIYGKCAKHVFNQRKKKQIKNRKKKQLNNKKP